MDKSELFEIRKSKATSQVDLWKNEFILIWLKDLNFDGLQQKGC